MTGYGRPVTPVNQTTDSLADILERVLDKGIVVAGDIVVNVVDIELLTLKVRLLVASVETARDLGINWWTRDPFLTDHGERLRRENDELRGRVNRLEEAMRAAVEADSADPADPADPSEPADPAGSSEPEPAAQPPPRGLGR